MFSRAGGKDSDIYILGQGEGAVFSRELARLIGQSLREETLKETTTA